MNKKDVFEPTIEESIMASGLHQQGNAPEVIGRASVTVVIPHDAEVNLEDVKKDVMVLAKRVGRGVDVQVRFSVEP